MRNPLSVCGHGGAMMALLFIISTGLAQAQTGSATDGGQAPAASSSGT